jgi:hypothetical protein
LTYIDGVESWKRFARKNGIRPPTAAEQIKIAQAVAAAERANFDESKSDLMDTFKPDRAEASKVASRARQVARSAGWSPKGKYPGSSAKAWLCRCTVCGKDSHIKIGDRKTLKCSFCEHVTNRRRLDGRMAERDRRKDRRSSEAEATLWEFRYDPLEDFPGDTTASWSVLCLTCGTSGKVKVAVLRKDMSPQWDPCRKQDRGANAEITQMMWDAGWEPLEPYPGNMAKQWRCRCTTCGKESNPRPGNTRRGARCSSCAARGRKKRKKSKKISNK